MLNIFISNMKEVKVMKRRVKKMLACFLALVMIASSGGFSAFQVFAETDVKSPEVASKTASSITLKTVEGYEYARRTVDDAGNKEWKWAKSDQYNAEKKTVSFTGLDAGTEYEFACRQKDVEGAELGTVKVTTAAAETEAPPETEKQTETKPAETTPPETEKQTEAAPAETTPPETEKQTETKPAETTPPETEKQTETKPAEMTPPETEKQTETAPPETKTDETKPAETKAPETEPTKTGDAEPLDTTGKPQPNAPANNNVLGSSSKPTTTTPPSTTNTTEPTPPSATTTPPPATTTTEPTQPTTPSSTDDPANSTALTTPPLNAPAAPEAPEMESRTDTEVHLKAVDQQEYALVSETGSIDQWQDSSVFTGLEAGREYEFVTRIKENGTTPASAVSASAKFKTKAAAAAAPAVPEVTSATEKMIQLKALPNQQYAMLTGNGPENWNTIGTFDNLQPGTEYSFVTRMVYDDSEAMPSLNSDVLKASTMTPPLAAPAAPEVESRTDTQIQLKAVSGQEYALVPADGVSYQWQDSPEFKGLEAGKDYSFVTRIKANGNVPASALSQPVAVKTKLAAAAAPAAPELQDRWEGSITLKAGTNLEYGIDMGDGTWKWQDSPEFMNVQPGTRYKFAVRQKYDPNVAMESNISAPAEYATILQFTGAYLEGVKNYGVYDFNTKLTVTAIGPGMDNNNPVEGDTRWVPRTWDWDGKNYRTWNSAPYSITFTLDKAGQYVLTINYEVEEYKDGAWKATGKTNGFVVGFTAKNPVYTINATAGKNGKIDPAGDIAVEMGKSQEFKFTPAKGYRVAKVTVDGKAVTVKNNKYTFTNVTGNHKLVVTFERDAALTAPKTGDPMPIVLLLGVLLISAMVIVTNIVLRRRHHRNTR